MTTDEQRTTAAQSPVVILRGRSAAAEDFGVPLRPDGLADWHLELFSYAADELVWIAAWLGLAPWLLTSAANGMDARFALFFALILVGSVLVTGFLATLAMQLARDWEARKCRLASSRQFDPTRSS